MTQTDQEEAASDLRSKRCCRRWMHQFADGYPRTFAIVVDMMLPMLVLGMIATAFGYWLSYLESPNEIINNDQQLQILNQQQYVLETIGNLTALTPRLCFRRYFDNNTEVEYLVNSSLQQAEINKNSTTPVLQQQLEVLVTLNLELQYLLQESEIKPQPPQSLVVVNATELYNYAVECGDRVRAFSNNITSSFSNSGAAYSLTFNWNRCTPIHSSDNQNSYESSLRPVCSKQTRRVQEISLCFSSICLSLLHSLALSVVGICRRYLYTGATRTILCYYVECRPGHALRNLLQRVQVRAKFISTRRILYGVESVRSRSHGSIGLCRQRACRRYVHSHHHTPLSLSRVDQTTAQNSQQTVHSIRYISLVF